VGSRRGSGEEIYKYSMKEVGKHVLIATLALMYANVIVSSLTKESCITLHTLHDVLLCSNIVYDS